MADHSYIAKIEPSEPDEFNAVPSERMPSNRLIGIPDLMKAEPSDMNDESECNTTHINIAPTSQRGRQGRQSSKRPDTLLTPVPILTLMPVKIELESCVLRSEFEIKSEPISDVDSMETYLTVTPVKTECNASEQASECEIKIKTEPIDSEVQILSPHNEGTTDIVTVKREPNSGQPDGVLSEGTAMVLDVFEDPQNSAWQKTVHVERTVNGSYILREVKNQNASTNIKLQQLNGATILKKVQNQHDNICTNPQLTVRQSTDISTSLNECVNTHSSTKGVLISTSKNKSENCDRTQSFIGGNSIKSEPNAELNDENASRKKPSTGGKCIESATDAEHNDDNASRKKPTGGKCIESEPNAELNDANALKNKLYIGGKCIKSEPNAELNDENAPRKNPCTGGKCIESATDAELNDDNASSKTISIGGKYIKSEPNAELNDDNASRKKTTGAKCIESATDAELNDDDALRKKLSTGGKCIESVPNAELNDANASMRKKPSTGEKCIESATDAELNDGDALSKKISIGEKCIKSEPNAELNDGYALSKTISIGGKCIKSEPNAEVNDGYALSKTISIGGKCIKSEPNAEVNDGDASRKNPTGGKCLESATDAVPNHGDASRKTVSPQRTYGVKNKAHMSGFRLFSSVPERLPGGENQSEEEDRTKVYIPSKEGTLPGGIRFKVLHTSEDGSCLKRASANDMTEPQVRKAVKNCVKKNKSSDTRGKRHLSTGEGRIPWSAWGGVFDIEPDLDDVNPISEELEDSSSAQSNATSQPTRSPTATQDQEKPTKKTMVGLPRGWNCELCPGRVKFETYAQNFLHHEKHHNLLQKTGRVDGGSKEQCCFCGRTADSFICMKTKSKRKPGAQELICAECNDSADDKRRRLYPPASSAAEQRDLIYGFYYT